MCGIFLPHTIPLPRPHSSYTLADCLENSLGQSRLAQTFRSGSVLEPPAFCVALFPYLLDEPTPSSPNTHHRRSSWTAAQPSTVPKVPLLHWPGVFLSAESVAMTTHSLLTITSSPANQPTRLEETSTLGPLSPTPDSFHPAMRRPRWHLSAACSTHTSRTGFFASFHGGSYIRVAPTSQPIPEAAVPVGYVTLPLTHHLPSASDTVHVVLFQAKDGRVIVNEAEVIAAARAQGLVPDCGCLLNYDRIFGPDSIAAIAGYKLKPCAHFYDVETDMRIALPDVHTGPATFADNYYNPYLRPLPTHINPMDVQTRTELALQAFTIASGFTSYRLSKHAVDRLVRHINAIRAVQHAACVKWYIVHATADTVPNLVPFRQMWKILT